MSQSQPKPTHTLVITGAKFSSILEVYRRDYDYTLCTADHQPTDWKAMGPLTWPELFYKNSPLTGLFTPFQKEWGREDDTGNFSGASATLYALPPQDE